MPMLSVIKHNKNKSDAVIKERLLFEVDFPDEHVFSINYISYFSIEDCNFLVLSRLFTSKFAVVNIDATTLNPHYFGVDCLTSIITAIHCTKDSRCIIGGYETGSIAIWNIIEIVDEYKNSSTKKKAVLKDDLLPFKLEFRTLLSSSAVDSSEIIAIDSNYDSEMFITVSKSLNITLHSIGNGQCLNWIKLSQHNCIVQGVQLSKNGYFVLVFSLLEKLDLDKPGNKYYRSKICTYGINGEKISSTSYPANRSIKGVKLLERTLNPTKIAENRYSSQQSMSSNLEFMLDDKIYFFDTNKVYIMNCIDFKECKEIFKNSEENTKYDDKILAYKCQSLNSSKIFAIVRDKNNRESLPILKLFEPMSKKWIKFTHKIDL